MMYFKIKKVRTIGIFQIILAWSLMVLILCSTIIAFNIGKNGVIRYGKSVDKIIDKCETEDCKTQVIATALSTVLILRFIIILFILIELLLIFLSANLYFHGNANMLKKS
ncbi:MAG: hypothetical protein ABII01_02395 [Candidatus Woesearchaeota archaeon]